MGMFDEVNFKMDCPKCGKPLSFQTKDRGCTMETLEPEDVNNFYAGCHGQGREPGCRIWIEFSRAITPPRSVPLTLAQVEALGFRHTVEQR